MGEPFEPLKAFPLDCYFLVVILQHHQGTPYDIKKQRSSGAHSAAELSHNIPTVHYAVM